MTEVLVQPHDFPRRILLAVSGISPQILTETLYKLAVEAVPAFIPTEIHLVSTVRGVELARETLFGDGEGQYYRLLKDYGLDPGQIDFGPENLHVIRDERGAELGDIHDEAANHAAANFILEMVRRFCADDQAAVHASMAGGRKTMGFYLAYAMSLLGRTQDRLSHILINPPFESSRDFFYPPPTPRLMVIRDEEVSTADARLILADIPFVRMGSQPALKGLLEGAGYSETVNQIQRSLDDPRLLIDFDKGQAQAHGEWLKLGAVQFSILAWLAIRAKLGSPQVQLAGNESANAHSLLAVMEEVGVTERSIRVWSTQDGFGNSEFGPNRTRINRKLEKQLGPAASRYQIAQTGKRPFARYALGLTPEQVLIKGLGHELLMEEVSKGAEQ